MQMRAPSSVGLHHASNIYMNVHQSPPDSYCCHPRSWCGSLWISIGVLFILSFAISLAAASTTAAVVLAIVAFLCITVGAVYYFKVKAHKDTDKGSGYPMRKGPYEAVTSSSTSNAHGRSDYDEEEQLDNNDGMGGALDHPANGNTMNGGSGPVRQMSMFRDAFSFLSLHSLNQPK